MGATVKLQVTSWSASATAAPASSPDGNTTCGQAKVARPSHGAMSLRNAVVDRAQLGLERAGPRAEPDGQDRERRAALERGRDLGDDVLVIPRLTRADRAGHR